MIWKYTKAKLGTSEFLLDLAWMCSRILIQSPPTVYFLLPAESVSLHSIVGLHDLPSCIVLQSSLNSCSWCAVAYFGWFVSSWSLEILAPPPPWKMPLSVLTLLNSSYVLWPETPFAETHARCLLLRSSHESLWNPDLVTWFAVCDRIMIAPLPTWARALGSKSRSHFCLLFISLNL